MGNIILNIPDGLNFSEKEMKRFLAAKMYESGKLTLGQAAELAGLSKTAFTEILSDYDVSIINYSSSDINDDVSRL